MTVRERPMAADIAILTGICLVVAALASVLVGGLSNVAIGVWMILLSLGLLVASGRSAVSPGNTLGPYWFSHDMEAAQQEHRAAAGQDRRTRRRAKAFALASIPVAAIGVLLAAV